MNECHKDQLRRVAARLRAIAADVEMGMEGDRAAVRRVMSHIDRYWEAIVVGGPTILDPLSYILEAGVEDETPGIDLGAEARGEMEDRS